MTDTNDLDPTTGVSRRRVLVRGAVLGGVVWAAPAVTTVGGAAFGQVSPPPGETDISFIAMNVVCGGTASFIKYEVDSGEFEDSPGSTPGCTFFTPVGTPADGDALGFTVSGPDQNGCLTVHVPAGCTIVASTAIKGGQDCCPGPGGSGDVVLCPCP